MAAFKIALINVPYDNDYRNNIRFDNRAQQESAFNIPSIFNAAISVNLAAGNLLTPTVYHKVTEEHSINDLLSYNYCVIENNQLNTTLKYLYYFIVNSALDSANQVKLELEMDLIQTYYIDLEFGNSFIKKAHLNRFIENGGTSITFDSGVNSKLFVREDIKGLAKRPVRRKRLSQRFNLADTPSENLSEILDSIIYCWVYAYCYPKDDGYKVYRKYDDSDGYNIKPKTGVALSNRLESDYTNPYFVVCYPIYKDSFTSKLFYEPTGIANYSNVTPDVSGLNKFIDNNGGGSNIISIKLSMLPPFKIDEYVYGVDWIMEGSNVKLIRTSDVSPTRYKDNLAFLLTSNQYGDGGGGVTGVILVSNQIAELISTYTQDIDISESVSGYGIQTVFNKNEIIGDDYNIKYNPKLLSYDFKYLSLTNDINNFEYDILKLGNDNKIITCGYSEILSPDITRGFARILIKGGVYNSEFNNNYRGLTFTQDNSQPFSINNLDAFLAQNKNFYLQRGINVGRQILNTAAYAAGDIAQGKLGQAAGHVANTLINAPIDVIQSELTLDNMKSAPELVENINGNGLLNLAVNGLSLYLDLYSALPSEIKIAADIMNANGYNYNQLDNIKNVDNIRKYFNYIMADVETINAPINISNKIHNKIRDIFGNGIRLWNWVDGKTFETLFDYTKENYEKWLEE